MKKHGEDGFALLIVAVAIAMLSLILGAALELGMQQADTTDGLVKDTELAAAIDGALATFEQQLASSGPVPLSSILRRQVMPIGNVVVTLRAESEFGKVDLNTASADVLAALFAVSGIDAGTTKQVLQAILERRTKFAAASLPTDGSRPEQFSAVSELRAIPGMTDLPYDCVQPDLTVYSELERPVARFASVRTKRALLVADFGSHRVSQLVGADRPLSAGDVIRVIMTARDASGTNRSQTVVIRATGARWQPFWVLTSEVQAQSHTSACPSRHGMPSTQPHLDSEPETPL